MITSILKDLDKVFFFNFFFIINYLVLVLATPRRCLPRDCCGVQILALVLYAFPTISFGHPHVSSSSIKPQKAQETKTHKNQSEIIGDYHSLASTQLSFQLLTNGFCPMALLQLPFYEAIQRDHVIFLTHFLLFSCIFCTIYIFHQVVESPCLRRYFDPFNPFFFPNFCLGKERKKKIIQQKPTGSEVQRLENSQ